MNNEYNEPKEKIVFDNGDILILHIDFGEESKMTGYSVSKKSCLEREWEVFAFDPTLVGALMKAVERLMGQSNSLIGVLDTISSLVANNSIKGTYQGNGSDIEFPEEEVLYDICKENDQYYPVSFEEYTIEKE